MKAIAIDDFGAPPSLHDLPVPELGEGEVLVSVRANSPRAPAGSWLSACHDRGPASSRPAGRSKRSRPAIVFGLSRSVGLVVRLTA
jgi:hypothetical protein